jgi:hypothetical protein
MAQGWMQGALMCGLLALPALAAGAEDDLAVVKKAVGSEAQALPKGEAPRARASEPRKGEEPRWLKVRIEDRTDKKSKVTLNLPLDLVRALDDEGEELPIGSPRHKGGKNGSLRLADVLRALKAGQDFVSIEDEDATVRVWVE